MSGYKPGGTVFSQINITPLTDVFLVLLVIMILIAPLANQTVLKVDIPPNSTATKPTNLDEKNTINVFVRGDGQVTIDGKNVGATTEEIQRIFESKKSGLDAARACIVLHAQDFAKQSRVVAVMDAAAGAKIANFKMMP